MSEGNGTDRYGDVAAQLHELRSKVLTASDEDAEKMQAELAGLEKRAAEALRRETTADSSAPVDAEERAVRKVEKRVRFGSYLKAAAGERQADGAEHEFLYACGGPAVGLEGTVIPFRALDPSPGEAEHRADATASISAATDVGTDEVYVPRVFPLSHATFIGLGRPRMVGSGEHAVHVRTAGPTPAWKSKGASQDTEAVTDTTLTLVPRRLPVATRFSVEDAARSPGFEPSLRADMAAAVGDALEKSILLGSGTSPNPQGLSGKLSITASSTAAVVGDYTGLPVGALDGTYGPDYRGMRLLCTRDVLTDIESFSYTNDDSMTALDFLERRFGAGFFKTSGHIPVSSNVSEAFLYRGMRGPESTAWVVWSSFSVTRDPYSEASSGLVRLTAHTLQDHKILRSGPWQGKSFKTA